MRTEIWVLIASIILPVAAIAGAGHEAMDDHPTTFHAFQLEVGVGAGRDSTVTTWDLDGWVGSDYNKLWLKTEGERTEKETHQAEFWALYSRNISEFWDFQAGLRHDVQPNSISYLAIGFDGLAPYFFETETHLFVSEDGDVSARLRLENDFLITQRLVLQPYLEVNMFAQDVPEQEVGAGLADAEIGLQTRYEIHRKFAPYLDLRYERAFGETSSIAKSHGEPNDDFIVGIGIKLMF